LLHCTWHDNLAQIELAMVMSLHVFFSRTSQGEDNLLCPVCHSDSPRRSRRRSFNDYLAGVARLRPWRCRACDSRFFAWATPIEYVWYVHCRMCGNLDMPRISSEHGMGTLGWLFRLFRAPAYRCAPCRNRFFSFRIYRRIVPAQQHVESRVEESHFVSH
jgi:hypothetical protein